MHLPDLFTEEWSRVLSRTFVHSLWQGLIAALLAAIIIAATQRSAAKLRYNLLSAVLLLFIAAGIITGVIEANSSIAIHAFDGTAGTVIINDGNPVTSTTSFFDSINQFLDQNSFSISVGWAFFFLFNLVKLSAGFYSIQRVRTRQVYNVPPEWKDKLKDFSQSMGISQAVQLFESGLVKVPVTLGYFKPVILLPLGLITRLPAQEIETILIHELAHIRRKDYIINIFQRLAEAIYFFNPGFMWISSLIRQEREACCDDMVVARAKNPRHYLDALVSFQEFALREPVYAMTVAGNKQYLLGRVKRMLTRRNRRLYRSEFMALTASVVLFSTIAMMPGKPGETANKKAITTLRANNSFVTVINPAYINNAAKKDTIPPKRQPVVKQKIKEKPLVKLTKLSGNDSTPNKKLADLDPALLRKIKKETDSSRLVALNTKLNVIEVKKADIKEVREVKQDKKLFESKQDSKLFETRKAILFEKKNIYTQQENKERQKENLKGQQGNKDRQEKLEFKKEEIREKRIELKEERKIELKEKLRDLKSKPVTLKPIAEELNPKLKEITRITPGNYKYAYQMTTISRPAKKAISPDSKLNKPSRQLAPVKPAPAQPKSMPPPMGPQPAG